VTILTSALLADLRRKAEAARLKPGTPVESSAVGVLYQSLPPTTVVALLDRIEALEKCLASSLQENLGWEDSHWGPEAERLLADTIGTNPG
jgi:hypothetical protein